MLVYDFEVFKYDWLVVIKDLVTGEYTEIVNDRDLLCEFYDDNKDDLFVGFNNSGYDDYIFKGLLNDLDPYMISYVIIQLKNKARLNRLMKWNDIPLNSYDVSFGVGFTGLKENEAYLGIGIDETEVDFNLDRPLTKEEIEKTLRYCRKDVDATALLFEKTISNFKTKLYLATTFGLDKSYINKGNQAIIQAVLGATKKYIGNDEFDGFDFEQLNIALGKYQDLQKHFEKEISEDYKSIAYSMIIAGVIHEFGIGGIHGARPNFMKRGRLMLIDVEAYYPSMMISYDWFARSIPDEYKQLYATMKRDRSVLKHTNKQLSDAYKLVLNTTYGCYKYKYGNLFDPRMANNICIGGQVMLVDLIEKIEDYCVLVQSNTDGIIVMPHDEESEIKIEEIVKEWEVRTKMKMEIEYGTQIYQKDVNNYVMEMEDGSIVTAGAYVKQYNGKSLRRNMRIVDIALVEYLIHKTPIEDTINKSTDPSDFMLVSKVGKTYDRVEYDRIENGQVVTRTTNNVNRSFATKDKSWGALYKVKNGKNRERVASHSDNNYIYNYDLGDFDMSIIDRDWYIEIANSRLKQYYGVK